MPVLTKLLVRGGEWTSIVPLVLEVLLELIRRVALLPVPGRLVTRRTGVSSPAPTAAPAPGIVLDEEEEEEAASACAAAALGPTTGTPCVPFNFLRVVIGPVITVFAPADSTNEEIGWGGWGCAEPASADRGLSASNPFARNTSIGGGAAVSLRAAILPEPEPLLLGRPLGEPASDTTDERDPLAGMSEAEARCGIGSRGM